MDWQWALSNRATISENAAPAKQPPPHLEVHRSPRIRSLKFDGKFDGTCFGDLPRVCATREPLHPRAMADAGLTVGRLHVL